PSTNPHHLTEAIMANFLVIDADGHLIEQTDLLRSYLKPPYDKRSGPLFHGEPWDGHLQGTLPANRTGAGVTSKRRIGSRSWTSTTWKWPFCIRRAPETFLACANPAMHWGSAALTMIMFTITGQRFPTV